MANWRRFTQRRDAAGFKDVGWILQVERSSHEVNISIVTLSYLKNTWIFIYFFIQALPSRKMRNTMTSACAEPTAELMLLDEKCPNLKVTFLVLFSYAGLIMIKITLSISGSGNMNRKSPNCPSAMNLVHERSLAPLMPCKYPWYLNWVITACLKRNLWFACAQTTLTGAPLSAWTVTTETITWAITRSSRLAYGQVRRCLILCGPREPRSR